MATQNHNLKHRRRVARGHRYAGIASAIVVLVLATTGILLNHADRFVVRDEPVRWPWLLAWYGLAPAGEMSAFAAGSRWVIEIDGGVYVDGEPLADATGPVIGAGIVDGMVALATADTLFLVDADDGLVVVERIGQASLPGPLSRLGFDSTGRVAVLSGARSYRADEALLAWSEGEAVAWSERAVPPEAVRRRVLERHRGVGIPATRVIADVHSGRIFGSYGFLVMDGAAVLLLLLTASGLYNWVRLPSPAVPSSHTDDSTHA